MKSKLIFIIPLFIALISVWLLWPGTNNKPNLTIQQSGTIYAYTNTNRELATSFLKTDDIHHLYTLNDSQLNSSLEFYLDSDQFPESSINNKKSQLDKNSQLLLKDILPQTDMMYTITDHGVKEDIVLKSKESLVAASSYSFLVKAAGLTPRKDARGNLLPEFIATDEKQKSTENYQLVPPYMTDAKGTTSYDVSLILTKTEKPNIYRLTLVPDEAWLADTDRSYPVRIDPTVVKGVAPIAAWHFDEASGTTAADDSANGNNLTISGATWTRSDIRNVPMSISLQFDGSNDLASRAYDADFDFAANSFSISGWFKHASSISGTDHILARYTTAGFKIYMDSSGFICFALDNDATWGVKDDACSTTSFADSRWHHLEAVKSETTSITLYSE